MTSKIRTLILASAVLAAAPINQQSIAVAKHTTPQISNDTRDDDAEEGHAEARTPSAPEPSQPYPPDPSASAMDEATRVTVLSPELRCLALNVYHEARSESEVGQFAVAAVTLNRVKSRAFPNSVCKVVKQGGEGRHRCQFSWWCDGKNDRPQEEAAWKKAVEISRRSLLGLEDDPTNGALYYHAKYVSPRWSQAFRRTARIGNHLFYKPSKREPTRLAVMD
jgi:N-acetylmuramoyl-L-alanine amidase